MILWMSRYRTDRPISGLPRLLVVASESIVTTDYALFGKNRKSEEHCLFKYTLSGEGVFRDGAGEHRMEAGSGFLCEINDPATAYYYPDDAREPWVFLWVALGGRASREMVRGIVDRYGHIYRIPRTHPVMHRLFETRKDDSGSRWISPSWGASMANDLLAALTASREESHEDGPEDVLIRRAREAVEENIGRDFNVTELAGMLNISREYLTRKFRERVAVTPHDYIIRQKILLACRLIKDTTLNNKEIAARLGYTEPAHFTRTFKRTMNMTPSRFRAVGIIPVV